MTHHSGSLNVSSSVVQVAILTTHGSVQNQGQSQGYKRDFFFSLVTGNIKDHLLACSKQKQSKTK